MFNWDVLVKAKGGGEVEKKEKNDTADLSPEVETQVLCC